MGLSAQGPVYRVLVSLDDKTLQLGGQAVSLRVGMTLQADLILEQRRIIEYLFAPLLGLAKSG